MRRRCEASHFGLVLRRLLGTAGVALVLQQGCTETAPSAVTADPDAQCSSQLGPTGAITAKHDPLRTGWYPDQPGLNPSIVGSASFGRIFATDLTGGNPAPGNGDAVMAQPLLFGDTLFVATESNNIYALDAATGTIVASRTLGPSWKGSDLGCTDLSLVGVTGTPVIDSNTGTAYFFSKTYADDASAALWYAHAVDAQTLTERPNFPVAIAGTAANDPTVTFNPVYQMQRSALLLMNGVVYGGFGSHCDRMPYRGFVIGVGEQGGVATIFSTEVGPNAVGGSGIWQSGGGPLSDASGRIFAATGNSYSSPLSAPLAGSSPPPTLGESVIRLATQPDGSLKPLDFFTPYDSAELDVADQDFGSSGPLAFPDCMGVPAHPHLIVAGGKAGTIVLLDRDNLGGFKQGPNEGDAYVSDATAMGSLFSAPALWPGDGGWVYVTASQAPVQAYRYGQREDGVPALAAVGQTSDTYSLFSGSPIVTSDSTVSGSALLWVTYTSAPWAQGELRAYNALPDSTGTLDVVYQDVYGLSSKFQVPGVGAGRIYVGTSNGQVIGYGAPVASGISGGPLDFGTLFEGATSTQGLVLTASQPMKVTAIASQNSAFTIGPTSPALPAVLAAGDTLSVPVTFAPTSPQEYVGSLGITTSTGVAAVSVQGSSQENTDRLLSSSDSIRFGGIVLGTYATQSIVLTDVGVRAVGITSVTLPSAPFTVLGAPTAGESMAGGSSVTVSVVFAPTTSATYTDTLVIQATSGTRSIYLSGTAATAPALQLSTTTLNFGAISAGTAATLSFTMTDVGGETLKITGSQPPDMGVFSATTTLDVGATIPAGTSLTETVVFQPTQAGTFSDTWIIGSDDPLGAQTVTLQGTALFGDASTD